MATPGNTRQYLAIPDILGNNWQYLAILIVIPGNTRRYLAVFRSEIALVDGEENSAKERTKEDEETGLGDPVRQQREAVEEQSGGEGDRAGISKILEEGHDQVV